MRSSGRAISPEALFSLTPDDLARWRADPTQFIDEIVINPETRVPFELLDAERDFLAHCFQVDDDGRLVYPEQVYGAPKKSGKTLFAALHTLVTVLVYGGVYAEGYCCANDLEQSVGRVFQAIRRIVEASPLLRADAKITASKIEFASTGATVTAIANDYAAAAGGNPTISTFDELWAFTSESSRRLWDEMVPPPTRKLACRLTVTYAGFEGESQLLEEIYKRGLSQPQISDGLHAGDGLLMLWSNEPIAPWQTPAWLSQMRGQLRANAYLRLIENRWVTSESSFVEMEWWDACVDEDYSPLVHAPDLPIWVGVDASTKRDSTAVVAVSWDGHAKKIRLVWHRVFQPSKADPLDFETTVAATVRELCGRFWVRAVRFDPYQMQAVAQQLHREGVPMVEFPQTVGNLTDASTNFYELIKGRNIVAYPDDSIRKSISQSIAVETTRGWRIAKEKSSHKIDVVVAMAMAAHAAVALAERRAIVAEFGTFDGPYASGGSWSVGNPGHVHFSHRSPEYWASQGLFHPSDRAYWIARGIYKPPHQIEEQA
jgi:phage terminase large subunit-like protein